MFTSCQSLIYLVDDDHDEHCLLQTIFSQHHTDCTLRCFSDGTELVTQLTHRLDGRLPDLILLDWQMPVLRGEQVLQLLKSDAQWRTIPVVVRSSSDHDNDINCCYELGGKAFIIKAPTYHQLADSVAALRSQWFN